MTRVVTDAQLESWHDQGFFRIARFAEPSVGSAMLERVVGIARRVADAQDVGEALVLPEQQPDMGERPHPEDLLSKIFLLAR